jgi:aspartate kinase
MKFGGTSVADSGAFARVARIVQSGSRFRLVVVVSAMSGFTDALLKSVQTTVNGQPKQAETIVEQQLERHLAVARSLLSCEANAAFTSMVEDTRVELRQLIERVDLRLGPLPMLEDAIVSQGEQLSAALLVHVLRTQSLPAKYVDARRAIVTDDCYGCATPLMEETMAGVQAEVEPLIAAGEIPVLGGFIAASRAGGTTTLGRGGSDYSAALIGAALHAREIEIWTDVVGVLTADPRLVPSAYTIASLSYEEAAELAYFGAKVLHPKTIQPAVERGIPVRVCSSLAPDERGTIIYSDKKLAPRTIKAIAHKTGITTLQITSARMLGAYGFLRALFEIFDRHRTVVDVIATSEVSVSLSLDDTKSLTNIVEELKRLGSVEVAGHRAIICVVGEGLRNTPGVAAGVFSTISDINVSLISLGASSINLTFVVEERHVAEAVRRLHHAYFESAEEQKLGFAALADNQRRELASAQS